MRSARELLDARGIPYALHVELGDKAKTISSLARKLRASQIVMGTSRKSSFTRMIEDSVTSKVLELTNVPVEVITGRSISTLERLGVPAGIGAVLAVLMITAE